MRTKLTALASAVLLWGGLASAQNYATPTIDGSDINATVYGASLALQTAPPGFGTTLQLGEIYVANDDTNLYIGIAGNNNSGSSGIYIFIDSDIGGLTNVAGGPTGGYGEFDDLADTGGGDMPTGFEASRILNVQAWSDGGHLGSWDGVANTAAYRGNNGSYTGGYNVAHNNANATSTPWSSGDVETGIEFQIPLADLGSPAPGTPISLFAIGGNVSKGGNGGNYMSNQLLPNTGTPIDNFGSDGSGGGGGAAPGLNYDGIGGPDVTPITYTIAAASTPGTYTWTGGDGDWTVAANWDPSRTAPATTDTLVFDSPTTVTGLIAETIAALVLTNNAEVRLSAPAAATLTVDGGSNAFHVGAGSSLRLEGANAITLSIPNPGSGLIEGDVIFYATAASVAHRILAGAAGAVTVADGGTTAMNPASTGGASGFGSSAANGIVFQSGAAHHQAAEKDGTRHGGTGTHPFALTSPSSAVVFEPGSTYYLWNGFANLQARNYANFVSHVAIGGTLSTVTGTNTWSGNLRLEDPGDGSSGSWGFSSATTGDVFVIEGNLEIVGPTGPVLNLFGTPAAAQNVRIRGDLIVDNPDRFNVDGTTNRFIVFDGSGPQTADANFGAMRGLIIDSDVNLVSPIAVLNSVTIEVGASLTASADGRLLLGAAAEPAPAGYAGPLGSAERLNVAGLNSATLNIPDAPVTFEVTTAGTGTTGVFAGWSETGTPPSVPALKVAVDRTWTLRLIKGSGYTGTLVFTYDDADLPGNLNEASLVAARWNGSAWDLLELDSTVDTVANTVTVTGITGFSEWTLIGDESATVRDWEMLD